MTSYSKIILSKLYHIPLDKIELAAKRGVINVDESMPNKDHILSDAALVSFVKDHSAFDNFLDSYLAGKKVGTVGGIEVYLKDDIYMAFIDGTKYSTDIWDDMVYQIRNALPRGSTSLTHGGATIYLSLPDLIYIHGLLRDEDVILREKFIDIINKVENKNEQKD